MIYPGKLKNCISDESDWQSQIPVDGNTLTF